METIIKIELPMKRIKRLKKGDFGYDYLPRWRRWLENIYCRTGGAIGDLSGRTNETRYYHIFRWRVLAVHRNEYHDSSDAERADEYLKKWSEYERKYRALRLLQMGDEIQDPETRKLLRDALGVNLDEGTVL